MKVELFFRKKMRYFFCFYGGTGVYFLKKNENMVGISINKIEVYDKPESILEV